MQSKCEDCGTIFEAKGTSALDILTGAQKCTHCGGNLLIISKKRK